MAHQSVRRGRKDQSFPNVPPKHAQGGVVPGRELPYGPGADQQAGQTAATDLVQPEFDPLGLKGRRQIVSGRSGPPAAVSASPTGTLELVSEH